MEPSSQFETIKFYVTAFTFKGLQVRISTLKFIFSLKRTFILTKIGPALQSGLNVLSKYPVFVGSESNCRSRGHELYPGPVLYFFEDGS